MPLLHARPTQTIPVVAFEAPQVSIDTLHSCATVSAGLHRAVRLYISVKAPLLQNRYTKMSIIVAGNGKPQIISRNWGSRRQFRFNPESNLVQFTAIKTGIQIAGDGKAQNKLHKLVPSSPDPAEFQFQFTRQYKLVQFTTLQILPRHYRKVLHSRGNSTLAWIQRKWTFLVFLEIEISCNYG